MAQLATRAAALMRPIVLGSLMLACFGCGSSGLDKETVTNLADGDAKGTALSGSYRLEIYTLACDGACPVFTYGLYSVTLCDVGDTDRETVDLIQREGHLEMRADSSFYISRFEGGIYSDGRFDIGGYATQYGGAVDITGRATGTVNDDGLIEAEVTLRGDGDVQGKMIRCDATYEVTGEKRSD